MRGLAEAVRKAVEAVRVLLPYVTLRDSTCGGTSKAATVAVTTRVVSLLI